MAPEKSEGIMNMLNEVCNIFITDEQLKGKRHIKVIDHKGKAEWAEFIKEIAEEH